MNILTVKITDGTVIDQPPAADGLKVSSIAKRKKDDLRVSHEGLLHQMMPLVVTEATYASNLKTRNDAVAAGLTK